MSRTLTRRSLVAAAPAAVVAAGLPAVAIAQAGDAHLLELGRQLARADAAAAEADRQLTAASLVYDRAAPDVEPEVLFVSQDDDLPLGTVPEHRRGKPTGRFFYKTLDIETAESALKALNDPTPIFGGDPRAQEKLARLREVVECHAARRDARRAAWHSCGMEEAEDTSSSAHDRCKQILVEIARCPATTAAGLQLKVRAAMHCFGDTLDEAEGQIDGVMEELTTGETLALSILKDMARMADRNLTGGLDA